MSTQKRSAIPARWLLLTLILTAACTQDGSHLAPPPQWPSDDALTVVGTEAYQKRRGQTEIVVKSNYEEIKDDIVAGGGPALTKAFEAAGVPAGERPTRILQLQSDFNIHATSPGALVTALMLYGS